jgi:nucleotide-binding universal stress UspA family protein
MFRQLLVPLDRSALAEQALGQATAIVRKARAALDVVLVHEPLPFAGFADAPWNSAQWQDEHKYLETIVQELATGASIDVSHSMMRGGVVEMICRRAHDIDADLIVMTSHGRTGISRSWLGSNADGVIRESRIPVLLLRPAENWMRHDAPRGFNKIVVPLDGSDLGAAALLSAQALARCSGASIALLRVVQPVPLIIVDPNMPLAYVPQIQDEAATDRLVREARHEMAEIARRTRETADVTIEAQVIVGASVAHAIIEFACGHDVDAIAMSTHGRGATRLLIGSVADKVLRASGLPMLLYRPVGLDLRQHALPTGREQWEPQHSLSRA